MIFLPPTRNGLQKTLDSQLDEGVTASMTLNNVTGVQAPGVVVINRIDTNNAQKAAALREYVSFTGISGNTLTGLTRALGGSTDQDHAVGSVVEFVFDVVQAQAIYDALRETVDADGTLDTTKVVDLTTAQTLTNKTLTSPKINENVALTATATELNLLDGVTSLPSGDGWTEAGETWTYASATTFTVSGDVTAKYQKGTRIKLTQTTVKYFVVTNSSHSGGTTTVTITGGTDYTLANAAITDNYYSYQANPQGYPAQFTLSSNQWLSIQGKQITLTGWGYEQGNGANFYTSGQTVSFGLTFASRPVVLISSAGYKDGSNPTHIGDTGGSWEIVNYTVGNITTTSFKASAGRTDGTAIPSSYRILYSWVAIGSL